MAALEIALIAEPPCDAIITVDDHLAILQFSPGASGLFGYTAEEVIGEPLARLLPVRVRVLHNAVMLRLVESGGEGLQLGRREEFCAQRRDGTEFPAEVSVSRVSAAAAPCYTVWLRDVTEQRRRDATQEFLAGIGAALGSSLDYLQTLARAARAATPIIGETCIIDSILPGGGSDVTVADTDPALEDLARVMRREHPSLYESGALADVRAAGAPCLITDLNDAVLDRVSGSAHYARLVRRIGWQSVLFVPIIAREVRLGILTCASRTRGLTAGDLLLATELAHRAALAIDNALLYRRAQQAANARDDVLGIVSHDLRGSLATINLCAGALIDREPPTLAGVRAMGDAIRHSVEHAESLISDLVDVTGLNAGVLRLVCTPVAPMHLLARAREAFAPLMGRDHVALRVVGGGTLPLIMADEARLLQVLFNLLGNALKNTRAGGTVTLMAAAVDAAGPVVFSVEDTGSGIDAEELPFLFDWFWQSRRSERGSAGLGLAIAKGLVESHGGHLSVISTPRVGSVFSFTIPAGHGE